MALLLKLHEEHLKSVAFKINRPVKLHIVNYGVADASLKIGLIKRHFLPCSVTTTIEFVLFGESDIVP